MASSEQLLAQIARCHLCFWPVVPIIVVMTTPTIAIRHAIPGDGPALSRLAALDSAPVLFGDVVLAEVDGSLHAALHVQSGRTVADPFARTAELLELLRLHAARLTAAAPAERHRALGVPRWARLAH